jgi:hypothetical protein
MPLRKAPLAVTLAFTMLDFVCGAVYPYVTLVNRTFFGELEFVLRTTAEH